MTENNRGDLDLLAIDIADEIICTLAKKSDNKEVVDALKSRDCAEGVRSTGILKYILKTDIFYPKNVLVFIDNNFPDVDFLEVAKYHLNSLSSFDPPDHVQEKFKIFASIYAIKKERAMLDLFNSIVEEMKIGDYRFNADQKKVISKIKKIKVQQ